MLVVPAVAANVKPLLFPEAEARLDGMAVSPDVGQRYRGIEGRLGFLLHQAQHAFATSMEQQLRPHGLTRPQFGVLSVLVADPGLSAADLARSAMVTPQAINLLVTSLERDGLVRRERHPTHGRVLRLFPTAAGKRRLQAAYPAVIELEDRIAEHLSPRQLTAIKQWLVDAAKAMRA